MISNPFLSLLLDTSSKSKVEVVYVRIFLVSRQFKYKRTGEFVYFFKWSTHPDNYYRILIITSLTADEPVPAALTENLVPTFF